MKKWIRWLKLVALAGVLMLVLGSVGLAEEVKPGGTVAEPSSAIRTVGLGAAAAFAIAVCVLGAGYAVGRIGAAALGAAAEKPELLTRSILFVALAEGLAVLGFAIAMMLVQKI
jgi:V/A-type H+/Na+-transporting ATPase subunit K